MIIDKFFRKSIGKMTASYYKKKYSKKIHNSSFTLFTSNCIGGIIYNRLGLKFTSPFINLWLNQSDFIRFLKNPNYYLEQELVEFNDGSVCPYPRGRLDDLTINFSHYHSFVEAKQKWDERKTRINWDNIFVILYDDEVTREELLSLKDVKFCKKIIILSSNKENLDIPNVIYIKKSKFKRENDYVFLDIGYRGLRTFEKQFDFVKWLND